MGAGDFFTGETQRTQRKAQRREEVRMDRPGGLSYFRLVSKSFRILLYSSVQLLARTKV